MTRNSDGAEGSENEGAEIAASSERPNEEGDVDLIVMKLASEKIRDAVDD